MTHADRYRQLLLTAASFAFLAVPSAPALSQTPVLPVVEPEISAEIPPQATAPGTQVMPSVPMTGAPLTPEQQIAPAESESANAAPSAQAPGMLQPDANVGVVDDAAAKQSTQASGTFEAMDPKSLDDLKNSLKNMQMVRGATESPGKIGTLFFTLWQHSLLQDAKRLYVTRRPTPEEVKNAADSDPNSLQPIDRGIREISLGGILYRGDKEWVVWLNGMRMVPDAIPKEVIDIKVAKTHIDLKWFDAYTNLIFPVRLRPHQRFNLDSRIFLPGLTAESAAKLQEASSQP